MNRLILVLLLFSIGCQTKPKIYQVYMGFEMPVSRDNYRKLADSVYNSEVGSKVLLEDKKILRAFFDNLPSERVYATASPKLDGNVVTGYRFYFIGNKTDFEMLSSETSQNDDYEKLFARYSNPEVSVINDKMVDAIYNNLSSKYGDSKLEATLEPLVTYDGSVTQVSLQTFSWKNDDIQVRMFVRTLSDGFIKVNVDYDLSDKYITSHRTELERLKQKSSKF